ncbi:KTSC domain-containing protein [Sphingomonas sp. ID1715]|nr:KTSC domain-containing protein [Sphingomonas sp. ID1715]
MAQIEYDAASSTLFVRFTSGEWYGYSGVPARLAAEFLAAGSKGRFFQEHVRDRFAHQGPLDPVR